MSIKQKIAMGLMVLFVFVGFSSMTTHAASCGGVNTSIINCAQTGQGNSAQNTGAWGVLLLIINIMTGGVGILAVGGIVYAAILYASAGDNAGQTKKAIEIITNVVIGLITFGAMYLLLNFLIPGGIFQ